MIKQERVNRFVAKKRVSDNLNSLKNMNKTIESIYQITFSHPNYTFLQVIENAGVKEITYQEADSNIKHFGSYLKTKIGEKSRYIGLLFTNKPEWIYCFYGLLMYGYIPVLLSTNNTVKQNEEILKEVNAKILVTDFDGYHVKVINPCGIKLKNEVKEPSWANEVVFISSGTSGPNKIVAFTGEEFVSQINNCGELFKKYPSLGNSYNHYLKHLVVLPFFHIFGFVAVLLWFSFFNVTFVLPYNLSPERIRQACLITEPSHIFGVPLVWDTITSRVKSVVKRDGIEKKFNKGINLSLKIQKLFPHLGMKFTKNVIFAKYLDDILGKSIQFCIAGGSFISEETLRIINGLGYLLINGYGSTELGISSFMNPKKIETRLKASIGKPFKTFQYSITPNDDGVNELYVKSNCAFNKSIVHRSWLKRNKEEFIKTYDSAEIINEYFYLKGRVDEIYIGENGENYSLVERENSFRLSYANDLLLMKENNSYQIDLLLSYNPKVTKFQIAHDLSILETNPEYKNIRVKNVYITNLEFPKANGIKIKRAKVYELFKEKPKEFTLLNINEYQGLINEGKYDQFVLEKIIKIFEKKYPEYSINANSDYFNDLKGNSLDYFYLVEEIERVFNIQVTSDFTLCRTPTEFAIKIKEISAL